MATLLKFNPGLKHDTLTVTANVTERETGEVRFVQSSITFHDQPLTLEVMDAYETDTFHPGVPYTTYVSSPLHS